LEDGGFVAWFENAINAESASVCGGQSNVSSGFAASVSGGYENSSASWYSTVGGGNGRSATAWYDWAAGEMDKTHQDHDPVIREGEKTFKPPASRFVGAFFIYFCFERSISVPIYIRLAWLNRYSSQHGVFPVQIRVYGRIADEQWHSLQTA
jgi:hypothetical protein